MNKILPLIFFLSSGISLAQDVPYPVFDTCKELPGKEEIFECFNEQINTYFYEHFHFPEGVTPHDFNVFFSATKEGRFKVLSVAPGESPLRGQVLRTFAGMPAFRPAEVSGKPIDKRFVFYYRTGREARQDLSADTGVLGQWLSATEKPATEPPGEPVYSAPLPIPFSHDSYQRLTPLFVSGKTHTAFKPLLYKYAAKARLQQADSSLTIPKTSWWGRKLLNEHMLDIRGDGYWFHLDPYVDLQVGKDGTDIPYTYLNTRALRIEGALMNKVGFYSLIAESQGRFARYFDRYALSLKPTQAYAVVPGRDVSKAFGDSGFDFPVSLGGISVSPMKFIDLSFGFDKHFIGDGYRSLFLSDTGSPYTFLKIDTRFWHIQYTSIWTWLRDVRIDLGNDTPFKRKFTAIHYLDWNVSSRVNIGLFESVTWAKTGERGFDVQYLNPVILFRAMEYANGSRGGNAMVGASAKFKIRPSLQVYSQFLLDELTVSEFFDDTGYWANKYAYQLGVKYLDAFKIENLNLLAEYNRVRPYTYSHSRASLEYGHVYQPLAHPWGANFSEWILRIHYHKGRWYGAGQFTGGVKGFDFEESAAYGGDIFRSYNERNADYGIYTGQGNAGHLKYGYLEGGYLINPATRLKIFGSVIYRDFRLEEPLPESDTGSTLWWNIGIRSDLPGWYFDY